MSRLSRKQLNELSDKWLNGTITPEEKALLQDWYNAESDHAVIWAKDASEAALFKRLAADFKKKQRGAKPARRLWLRSVAAAVMFILVLAGGLFFFWGSFRGHQPEQTHDIPPGGNRATLTFADGRSIDLSTEQSGIVVGQETLTYNDGSSVAEIAGRIPPTRADEMLSLTTPKGGQYQIVLGDGTKVWLNAASTLKYPSQFNNEVREVEISGEAYFEVSPDHERPFKVFSRGQEIEVLGTVFNVQAYTDGPATTTTLIEGEVRVQALQTEATPSLKIGKAVQGVVQEVLSPGQEAVLLEEAIHVGSADIPSAIAWKDGLFRYNGKALEEIMQSVARWYQVEVVYDDESLKKESFVGMVSRYENISGVLGVLEEVGNARFTVDGNTVFIQKKK